MSKGNIYICAATKCYSSILTHPNKSFFGFPSDVAQCKIWLENCGRTDLCLSRVCNSKGRFKLCEDHFEDKWFTDSTKKILKRKLNPIPTIFLSNIDSLLPPGSQKNSIVNVDLPIERLEPLDVDFSYDPLCEDVLSSVQPFTESERFPISYHSTQLLKPIEFNSETVKKSLLNLKPETELYVVDEICRFCTNKVSQNYIDIFSESDEAREIRRVSEMVLRNKIAVCDGLPHRVCNQCTTGLKTCQRLIEQFQNADRYLRAIAKYSLFIENEDTGEKGRDCEEIEADVDSNDVMKPIPKNALVMPLITFQTALEGSYGCLDRINIDMSSNSSNDLSSVDPTVLEKINDKVLPIDTETCQDGMNLKPAVCSLSQLLGSLKPPSSQSASLLGNDQDLWQNSMNFVYGNIVILSNMNEDFNKPAVSEVNLNEVGTINNTSSSDLENTKQHENHNVQFPENFVEIPAEEFKNKQNAQTLDDSNYDATSHDNLHDRNTEPRDELTCLIDYKCVQCSKRFDTSKALEEHSIVNHLNPVNLCCCNRPTFPEKLENWFPIHDSNHYQNKFESHVNHLNKKIGINKTGIYGEVQVLSVKCTSCGGLLYDNNILKNHIPEKDGLRTECSVNNKQITDVQNLRKQESSQSQNTKEICWICGIVFENSNKLIVHLELHDDQTYHCENCGEIVKISSKAEHEKLHRAKHKKFVCNLCPKRFVYKLAFNNHMDRHSKPLACKPCGKRFVKRKSFLEHIKEHRH